ncbi:MAG TPA: shikimate kinase [Candidatus Saccharimonadales bacterium]
MRIVLIGFMASGKSSVAPLLASALGLEVVEMDALIVAKAGKSIKDIFEAGGEPAFRKLEAAVAAELQNRDNVVISTGGGVVARSETMKYLTDKGVVVELSCSFDALMERIRPTLPRPLFKDEAQAKATYAKRQSLYHKYASVHVNTDGKSVDEIVEAVFRKIQGIKKS